MWLEVGILYNMHGLKGIGMHITNHLIQIHQNMRSYKGYCLQKNVLHVRVDSTFNVY